MKPEIKCTNPRCAAVNRESQDHIIKYGFYRRGCDSKRVQRFRCKVCKQTVSNQTFNRTYREHKPRVNCMVEALLCSKVSMRQIGRVLGIDYKTVARKMTRLAEHARISQMMLMAEKKDLTFIQMDEMETFEHTKCKPLSIALAVEPETRHILAANVAIMPAKGLLAAVSRKKYGPREDERKEAFQDALLQVKDVCRDTATILTDKKTAYGPWIRSVMPNASHIKTKGRRGCVVGYGELKEGGYDPLFMLNHTAAMIRDNLARMLRRTWCTTKLKEKLEDALDLYVWVHNKRMGVARQH